jgi:serine/threonine protein kinase
MSKVAKPVLKSPKQVKKDPETIYTVLERVGKGAFGEVFRGQARETGQTVAIKIIDLEGFGV